MGGGVEGPGLAMGAIGGDELMRWEKLQGGATAREEKILVLVRLRPLSEKEIARNEVSDWECINDTTILFRNSLQERSMFPTAHTFDRVYGGDCSTKQVYEEGAKEIALSVVSGINSSIFAYGQTSSGKTYTMIGITEYTVADIYDYINRHEERAFVLKFSAMEIYNEAVRDLLSVDTTPLRVLDDPERGTSVEKLTEETLRDWGHLRELLSICEAQRRTGETSLNETSSRSHQILRLTIESSAREFLGKDKSTTLAASVNFIDLAGSERASQALSAGARLKEGCHINRSLLTLGTVIRKLSKGRNGHVNYRDSKLTRILQPCLGGNARTAIICTLSPARSHVEQSRNTLLFASCAKEVTTNAQVNVVLSDKALVKHLQKELARLESELRTPVPAYSNIDYSALLRKKDLQIEKMEKEIRELTKQRDLAQSRIEDLLRVVRNDQASNQVTGLGQHPNPQEGDTWEDECSISEASGVDSGVRKFNTAQYSNRNWGTNSEESRDRIPENTEDHYQSDATSPLLIRRKLVRTGDDTDDLCKEVRCIEVDESSKGKNPESNANVTNQEAISTVPVRDSVTSNIQNGSTYGILEQQFQDVQKTIDSLVNHEPDEPLPEGHSSRSSKISRSWSCRVGAESTPPSVFEKDFHGRPEAAFGRKLPPINYDNNVPRLSRNDSQSSIGSVSLDVRTSGDEEITTIQSFVAGMKEKADKYGKNVKDVGLDPMQEGLVTPPDWPLEFERQQKLIFELWQSCNVSLVHRTYFFLLFKGDPTDSIYMEVELRRLTFLKETFSRGNQAVEDGRILTLASSLRALHRERDMLCKLMRKRYSEEERSILYEKWGIGLESKRRRLQLVNQLWSNTKDMNYIIESAAIVARLVRFLEQGQVLKEMFGLSFKPPPMRRRSYGWKNSRATLL